MFTAGDISFESAVQIQFFRYNLREESRTASIHPLEKLSPGECDGVASGNGRVWPVGIGGCDQWGMGMQGLCYVGVNNS